MDATLTFEEAESFFKGNRPRGIPSDSGAPDIERLAGHIKNLDTTRYRYAELKTILTREHERLGAGKTAAQAIESIDGRTVYVVSGQQAGLFGGPLYTCYKAMHAIRLSSRLSDLTGRHVIPLFWVASDDHDFDEVRRLGLRTGDGTPRTVDYSPERRIEGAPVGEIVLDGGVDAAIETLADSMLPGERSISFLDIIRDAWKPGRLWSDAFTLQMLRLFSPYGLVLFDPRWNGVKELFGDVFITEISDPLRSTVIVNEEADAFDDSRMRKKALRKPSNATNLFLTVDGVRLPLLFEGQRFRAGEHLFSMREMLDTAASAPGRFSPAASLRPICQDAVIPVAAQISGPGERLYLEQIKPLYALFGVTRSIPWPRASFTVVEPRIHRTAEKEKIPLRKMFADVDGIRTNLADRSFPMAVREEFDSLKSAIEEGFARLAEHIAVIDPTLVDSVKNDTGKALRTVEGIRKRALRAHKATLDVSGIRLASASYFLLPKGGPQEQWFGIDSIFPFLGEEGFDQFVTMTSPSEECHRIVLP